MNARTKTEVAVNSVGIMITPNHPRYSRLLVEVMNEASRAQGVTGRSDRTDIEQVNMLYENFTNPKSGQDCNTFMVQVWNRGQVNDTVRRRSSMAGAELRQARHTPLTGSPR